MNYTCSRANEVLPVQQHYVDKHFYHHLFILTPLQVDGQSLEGFSNVEAVEVLRKTQSVVRLKVARQCDGAAPGDVDQEQEEPMVTMEEQEVAMEEPDLPPVAPADYPPPEGMLPPPEGIVMLGTTLDETADDDMFGKSGKTIEIMYTISCPISLHVRAAILFFNHEERFLG